jgi:Lon protease-like protein
MIGSLPHVFPIFPLSRALLLPRGRLPLNIFEPRYLNMVDESLAAGRMFGMIQPRARPARDSGTHASADEAPGETGGLHRIGCLGRVSSFAETDDGCYLITLVGLARFRVVEEQALYRGFRTVSADFSGFEFDLGPALEPSIDRDTLIASLRKYFSRRGLDANWDAVTQMDDDALVTTLCMVCPFSDVEKQMLLEAPDEVQRAQDLHALLEIGSHETDDDEGPGRAS